MTNFKNEEGESKCCSRSNMRRGFWHFIMLIVSVLVFGFVFMYLWNYLLPSIIGVKTITFFQAIGLLILSKILFGKMSFGRGHHACYEHRYHHAKWMNMSDEEKENFKSEWRNRCSSKC